MSRDSPATAILTSHSGEMEDGRRLRVSAAMLSHVGCVRSSNEDCVLYSVPDESGPDAALGVLALVADGMGGHAAGEVASRMAADSLHYLFYRQCQPVAAVLAEGFAAANHAIYERGLKDPNCAGMGTTCTAIVIRDNRIWLGHVGDSRAYLIRSGKMYKISEDHSLVAELIRQGTLTAEDAKTFPQRNVILRALGVQPTVEPMVWREGLPTKSGDILVLCSDGLSDVVDENAILGMASRLAPFEACETLIQAAIDAKAPDNVSVGVIAISTADDRASKSDRTTLQIEPATRSQVAK